MFSNINNKLFHEILFLEHPVEKKTTYTFFSFLSYGLTFTILMVHVKSKCGFLIIPYIGGKEDYFVTTPNGDTNVSPIKRDRKEETLKKQPHYQGNVFSLAKSTLSLSSKARFLSPLFCVVEDYSIYSAIY